ncbi:ABC transporter ATP-binding protein [Salinirubellus salinus]|uniref:Nickel import system ATP-binding protein NikD n=1 Tax=Salinirubellus salinus TaxID=1364945 RepID=A0A9E7QZZ2_9EURY|nr:ABC transporter ATP-binding protein [Salinirubellus salinus]UWM53038.1 ABC transporter ATP-binding protein [Salinirubellus salinus]
MSQQTQRPGSAGGEEPVLAVDNLQTSFFTDRETIRAVDGISFEIGDGETVGIVGESGSGKSVTARSIMGLVDTPGRVVGGSVRFSDPTTVERLADDYPRRVVDVAKLREQEDLGSLVGELLSRGVSPARITGDPDHRGLAARDVDATDLLDGLDVRDLVKRRLTDRLGVTDETDFVVRDGDVGYVDTTRAPEPALRGFRGSGIAMIFQDPLTSLNPVYTVGNQIKEALRLHQNLRGKPATDEAIRLLEAVQIPDARRRIDEYPHQFSGGMRQRAVIAMALACQPELLICDEPTTALDVTIQAQILELLDELQEERDLSIMFITHDMGVIAEIADRVNVMYAGEVVESAPVEDLFANPKHPYTQGLLASIPGENVGADRLATIEGDVPTPNEPPTYCRFAPRCPEAFEACEAIHPQSVDVSDREADHTASCLLYPEDRSEEEAVAYHRDLAAEEVSSDD